jgi:hypothetical protein
MKLPAPAAPATTPSSSSCLTGSPSVCARTANAANIIRNPVSKRTVALPDSATTTCLPIGWRRVLGLADSDAGTSPSVTSTHAGIRIACTAPTPQMSAVNHSAPGESNICRISAATPPKAAPATRPNTVSRALVLARVISGGTTLGVTAAFSTVKDLDSTIFPSAAGYSSQVSKLAAMTTHIRPWPIEAAHMASRRPRWMRSSIGPITGASSANGATVISR